MKLHYKKFGKGEPLIVLHGLMGMLDNWQSPAKKFAEDFEVFIVDQRNHGHSPHSEVFNYRLMMEDLLEFMDFHELGQAHLLGHSMGGKTVMKVAQNHPEYVDKLVVVDIAPRAYEVHHQQILKGLQAVNLNNQKSRREADETLKQYIPEMGVRQFLLKNLYWKEKGQLAWRFNLPVINDVIADIGEEVADKQHQGETLFIGGQNSNYIQDSDKEMIDLFFPNSTLITIPNAGHWVHAEQPDKFIEATLDFLNS